MDNWINVKDEMPTNEFMVIVCFFGSDISVGYPHKGKILDSPLGFNFTGVTHWMRLPTAPREINFLKCEYCGVVAEDVDLTIRPYTDEIYSGEVEVTLCTDCYNHSGMEV